MKLCVKVVVAVTGCDDNFELVIVIHVDEGGDCVFVSAAGIKWEAGDHRAVEFMREDISILVCVNNLELSVSVNITERGNLNRAAGLQ